MVFSDLIHARLCGGCNAGFGHDSIARAGGLISSAMSFAISAPRSFVETQVPPLHHLGALCVLAVQILLIGIDGHRLPLQAGAGPTGCSANPSAIFGSEHGLAGFLRAGGFRGEVGGFADRVQLVSLDGLEQIVPATGATRRRCAMHEG